MVARKAGLEEGTLGGDDPPLSAFLRLPSKFSCLPPTATTMFQIVSPHTPAGDQPTAIVELQEGLARGDKAQVLLGATGTGKTFSLAHVIADYGRPTLVTSHN